MENKNSYEPPEIVFLIGGKEFELSSTDPNPPDPTPDPPCQ